MNTPHIESLSNGFGSQSMLLLIMAIKGEIPATVSTSADTGWENDCLWNTGRRSTARQFFEEVIMPLCHDSRVTPYFVRAVDKDKKDLPPLGELVGRSANGASLKNINIPLFGSRGGRLRQTCTDKWKIRAINQQHRRLGAVTARTAQGIHIGEADRRVKGQYKGFIDGFHTYQTTSKSNGVVRVIKWLSHYYPLVDARINREKARAKVEAEGVPYVVSSQCNGCPHQDLDRWQRLTPDTLSQIAETERRFDGEYFFTDKRIPLMEAIEEMKKRKAENPEADFGCQNDICGV